MSSQTLTVTEAQDFLLKGKHAVKPTKVAILGFGTVGSSVAKILCNGHGGGTRLHSVFNRSFERKRAPWVPSHVRWTDRFEDVVNTDVDVVLELVGGVDEARSWVMQALVAGKSVITANKQLIARHGPELLRLAQERGCRLLFGAAVAGGIPVITALEQGLAGDELFAIRGVLNGTCNFVLSKVENGSSFEAALAEAQELGFAEADPTDDVEGYDARAKLVILARVALRAELALDQVHCRSIATVSHLDFEYAHDLDRTIRQVAHAGWKNGKLHCSVQPMLVPKLSPLARAQGCENAVIASGRFGGDNVFAGLGAGGNATAVAVVSDLLALDRGYAFSPDAHPRRAVVEDSYSKHYIRFVVHDCPGIIAAIAGVLGKNHINIDAILQRPGFEKTRLPFVVTVEECSSRALEAALQEIASSSFLLEKPLVLPVLG